jgi:hypothetical protein
LESSSLTFLRIEFKIDLAPYRRRDDIIKSSEENRYNLWEWLIEPDEKPAIDRAWEKALGIYFLLPKNLNSIFRGRKRGPEGRWSGPAVEVHSVRTTRRIGPDGQDVRQLVIEVTQRRRGYFDPARQKLVDAGSPPLGRGDFIFRGGATLIIDLWENRLRYVIRKSITDGARLNQQRELLAQHDGFGFTHLGDQRAHEPFAVTHRGQ